MAADLNILWSNDSVLLQNKVKQASTLGYEFVAINYIVEDLKGKKAQKKEKQEPLVIKLPDEILLDQSVLDKSKVKGRRLEQLSRFSTVITDAAQTHKLQTSKEVQQYDIRAVRPTSEKTFQQACGTLDIDIISLDLTEKLPFFFRRQQIGVALERGIHFEISYTPAIRDATARRNIISNATSLIDVCKGKNIIISSACERPIDLRSDYDIANLALLFGLSEQQAKNAVTTNCRSVILHAKSRKTANCVLSVTKASNLTPGEEWKVKAAREENSSEDEDDEDGDDNDGDETDSGEPPTKKPKS